MKISASIVGSTKKLAAWTTQAEPDVALTIIVPVLNAFGEKVDVEVGIDRKSLLAAVKAGALNANA